MQPPARSIPVLWHLTSLDAPLIAALWCWLLAWRMHLSLDLLKVAALALAVWMLYAGDRLLDAVRNTGPLEERHRFHRQHWRIFCGIFLFTTPLLLWLISCLPAALKNAWLLLALPLALYFVLIHLTKLHLPKELIVAIFFAAACAMPTAIEVGWLPVLRPTLLFGLMCWANCIAIARWERDARAHAMTLWGAQHLRGVCVMVAVVAATIFFHDSSAIVALACLLAAATLWFADTRLGDAGSLRLRVLADAALLTPLLILPLLPAVRQQTMAHLVPRLVHAAVR